MVSIAEAAAQMRMPESEIRSLARAGILEWERAGDEIRVRPIHLSRLGAPRPSVETDSA